MNDKIIDQAENLGIEIGKHQIMNKLTSEYFNNENQYVRDFILKFIRENE